MNYFQSFIKNDVVIEYFNYIHIQKANKMLLSKLLFKLFFNIIQTTKIFRLQKKCGSTCILTMCIFL